MSLLTILPEWIYDVPQRGSAVERFIKPSPPPPPPYTPSSGASNGTGGVLAMFGGAMRTGRSEPPRITAETFLSTVRSDWGRGFYPYDDY